MKDIYYCKECEKFTDRSHSCGWSGVYQIPAAAVEAIKADKHIKPELAKCSCGGEAKLKKCGSFYRVHCEQDVHCKHSVDGPSEGEAIRMWNAAMTDAVEAHPRVRCLKYNDTPRPYPEPVMPDTVFISRNPSNKALQVFTVRDVGEAEYRRVKPCECNKLQGAYDKWCSQCGGRVAE